ncbi:MAG: N-6 DNA methylase [candidate division Zixibacteria bacterium]|nr:N-6 DNA methylase [candidate division Zixibacteria bacterium]
MKTQSSNSLISLFGIDSISFSLIVPELYHALLKDNPNIESYFSSWYEGIKLFLHDLSFTSKTQKKWQIYDIDNSAIKQNSPVMLFALQTYLSLILKMLTVQAISSTNSSSISSNLTNCENSENTLRHIEMLESEEYFKDIGLTNYLEDNPYSWIQYARSEKIALGVNETANNIQGYFDSAADNETADVLQNLYQSILPKQVRHRLGEYYTPYWLAAHVLRQTRVSGGFSETLLDPACGSGVFLLAALDYKLMKNKRGLAGAKRERILSDIVSSLCGFDINPLAVQATKTNIAIKIAPYLSEKTKLSFPVYVRDALQIQDISPVDIVIGNPPWVFWNSLPKEYRETIKPLMTEKYLLSSPRESTMKRLGSAGKDLSMLFFYVSLDKYVKNSGRLAFILPQSVLQSTAADEFRRFKLPDGANIRILKVEDWVKAAPFEWNTNNRTAIIYADKKRKTKYPVRYIAYSRSNRKQKNSSISIDNFIPVEMRAYPHNDSRLESFWIVSDTNESAGFKFTPAEFQARLGIETKLESVFRIKNLHPMPKGHLKIQNDTRRARIIVPEVDDTIEGALVYPFVSGASMYRWGYSIAGYYLVPHTAETGMNAIDENSMAEEYPKSLAYFKRFAVNLEKRSIHKRWGKRQPFYSMYGIGPYSFAPFRVAWKRTTRKFAATVLTTVDDNILGNKLVLANGKVMIIPFENADEAYWVCAVLNSDVFSKRINSAITSEAHRDIINVIPWKKYDVNNPLHYEMVSFSKLLHRLTITLSENKHEIDEAEKRLNAVVKKDWNIR